VCVVCVCLCVWCVYVCVCGVCMCVCVVCVVFVYVCVCGVCVCVCGVVYVCVCVCVYVCVCVVCVCLCVCVCVVCVCVCVLYMQVGRLRSKCDGTRAETRFCLSAKRTSLFKSAGALVHSTTGSRGVSISGSNAGYTMFQDGVKGTGYPLHSLVSPSLLLPCVTVCHHISTGP